jgi:hypothetical protein
LVLDTLLDALWDIFPGVKAARTDRCGGRSVTSAPTAIFRKKVGPPPTAAGHPAICKRAIGMTACPNKQEWSAPSNTSFWAFRPRASRAASRKYPPHWSHTELDGAADSSRLISAESPEQATRGADLICLATGSNVPVLFGAWLSAGQHVTLSWPAIRACYSKVQSRGHDGRLMMK